MKRYIRSNESVSADRLFSSISVIYIVPDASKIEFSLSEDIEIYSDYTDDELLQLPDYEIDNICNPIILDRIRKLMPDRVSAVNAATIADFLSQKFSLNDSDIKYVLEKLSKCNSIEWTSGIPTGKSGNFIRQYHITTNDILNIINNLTVKDLDHVTNSYSTENAFDQLIVFLLNRDITLESGDVINGMIVYLKVDFTGTTRNGDTAAVMSIHPADSKKTWERMEMKARGEDYPRTHIKRK